MPEDIDSCPLSYRRLDNYVGAGWRSRRQKAVFVWGMIVWFIVDEMVSSYVHDWKSRVAAFVVQMFIGYLLITWVLRKIEKFDQEEAEASSAPPDQEKLKRT